MTTRARITLLTVGLSAWTHVAAVAQARARSFAELRSRVQSGETVTVTDPTGRETTGRVNDIDSKNGVALRRVRA